MTQTETIWLVKEGADSNETSIKSAYTSPDEAIEYAENIEFDDSIYTTGTIHRYKRDNGALLIRHLPNSIISVEPTEVI